MNGFSGLLQLVAVAVVMVGMLLVYGAPYILIGLASAKRDEYRRKAVQQAEIDRKIAIAEAAMAARARGETFIPPADYDR